MKSIYLRFFATTVVSIVALSAQARTNEEYVRHWHVTAEGDTLPYRLLEPETVAEGEKYPLVVYMHGAGERGTDNERQLIHGSGVWTNPVNREQFPCYVFVPQCPETGYWAYDSRPDSFMPTEMPIQERPSKMILEVMEVVDSLLATSSVDPARVYVMGLSMGGMATFDMAVRYPDVFAAAVPICGTVNPARLQQAKNVAFRIYHGDADTTVPCEGSREAYRELRRLGADVIYIELPAVGHNSWTPCFTDREFLPWLFSQTKK